MLQCHPYDLPVLMSVQRISTMDIHRVLLSTVLLLSQILLLHQFHAIALQALRVIAQGGLYLTLCRSACSKPYPVVIITIFCGNNLTTSTTTNTLARFSR